MKVADLYRVFDGTAIIDIELNKEQVSVGLPLCGTVNMSVRSEVALDPYAATSRSNMVHTPTMLN